MKDWLELIVKILVIGISIYIIGRILTKAALKEIDRFLYNKFNKHSTKTKNDGNEEKRK
jgi:ABC-type nickel/cobalt efflux system permease component RcnA